MIKERGGHVSLYIQRVHNSFGGKPDLTSFVAIFGMGAENRSGKREFQLRVGSRFCVIKGSRCDNRKGKVAGYSILIFTRLHDLTSSG